MDPPTYVHIYVYICIMYVCICTHACMHVRTYACMYICTFKNFSDITGTCRRVWLPRFWCSLLREQTQAHLNEI